MTYANMANVPTQTAGVSPMLASDWNTYVKDNFDDIKAGHIVCTSSTRPSTGLVEGVMIFETDTNKVLVYDGASWVEVHDLDNTGGLASSLVTAGGDLSGSYPNPTIASGAVTTGKLDTTGVVAGTYPKVTVGVDGRVSDGESLVAADMADILSSSTPANLGTAAAGTSSVASRSDHVHALPTLLSNVTLTAPFETVIVDTSTAPNGTMNVGLMDGTVQYYTANATANFTFNFRGTSNGSVSLNSLLDIGESVTTTMMITLATTGWLLSAVQVDSSVQTVKWRDGSAPSTNNPNSVDIYTFTIIKRASATFNVFGSRTKFA